MLAPSPRWPFEWQLKERNYCDWTLSCFNMIQVNIIRYGGQRQQVSTVPVLFPSPHMGRSVRSVVLAMVLFIICSEMGYCCHSSSGGNLSFLPLSVHPEEGEKDQEGGCIQGWWGRKATGNKVGSATPSAKLPPAEERYASWLYCVVPAGTKEDLNKFTSLCSFVCKLHCRCPPEKK